QHEDFDHWRQLGNQGWGFADVLPYFRRAEDQERGSDEMHGTGGPLAVSNVSEPHPLCEAFIDAAQQAGHPRNDDFNGERQEGAGYFQLTAKNGRRWSTAVGYLRPAKRRPNLKVETETLAIRLLFSGRRAIGVVADMPGVGADLQDHLQIRMLYCCTEPITMNDVINNWRHRMGAGLRYILSRKGLLTIGAGYAGAFLRTRAELETPDVHIHFLIFS